MGARPQKEGEALDDTLSLLSRTVAAANRYLVQSMSEAGLDGLVPSHGDILAQLFAEDGIAMCDLANRIHRDPSTVTTLIKKLVASGYVHTQRSKADGRVTVVLLTERGHALEGGFRCVSQNMASAMNEGVSPEERAALRSTLEKMKSNFEEATGD